MPDTLFFNEIGPLTAIETGGYSPDTGLLPSGEQAVLYDNGTGGVVVEIFAPGAPGARLQLTLPLPDGHQHDYYPPVFAQAPDGSLAVAYRTYTSHTVDDGYGSYEEPDQTFLNAVRLADDGNSLSGVVELDSQAALSVGWGAVLHFDDGGFAVVSQDYSAPGSQIQHLGPDGSTLGDPLALPGGAYNILAQALSGGKSALVFREDGQAKLQILAADGVPIGAAQDLPVDDSVYIWAYGNAVRLLEMADGTAGVLWLEGAYSESPQVMFARTDSSGVLLPAVPLTALSDALSSSYPSVSDVQVFNDGTLGVLVLDESYPAQVIYQHLDADGTALADPAVLFQGGYFEIPQISLLPDGGAVLLQNTYTGAGGQALVSQFFAADGTPLGPQTTLINLPEGEYLYSQETQIQADGSAIFSWNVQGYTSESGWETRSFQTTLAPIPFRGLTEGDDIEVLSAPEAVDGLGGDDMITGSDGTDRLVGSGGDDTLTGGAGNDFLYGGTGDNLLDGGSGNDAAYFASDFADFSFAFNSDGSTVTVTGSDSRDVVSGVEQFDFLDQSLSTTELLVDGGFYDELLEGTEVGDTLDGGLGDDTLRGNGGDDSLDGGVGRDRINGGDGNDLILGGPADTDSGDRIFGGAGDDTIDGGGGQDEIYGQGGSDLILGGFGADQLFGQTGDDVITGGAWSDLIFGGDGDDFLNGGWGHDRINGGAGADKFFHAGVLGHGTDWLQGYQAEEGDQLVFGNSEVSFDDFTVHFAHTDGAGDADVAEAFIVYSATGVLAWALIDGAAQDQIWLKIPDQGSFDLLG
jgi:hypothetical protein